MVVFVGVPNTLKKISHERKFLKKIDQVSSLGHKETGGWGAYKPTTGVPGGPVGWGHSSTSELKEQAEGVG